MKAKKKILLVDDERHFRFAAGLALRKAGYDVGEASDGSEALVMMEDADHRKESFDLVVTDIQMREVGGVELIDTLVRHRYGIPVLVVTGFLDEQLLTELIQRKCNACVEKPVSPEDLVLRVGQILAGRRKIECDATGGETQREGAHP